MIRLGLIGYGRWGKNYHQIPESSMGGAFIGQVSGVRDCVMTDAQMKECDAIIYAGHPSMAAHYCERVLAADKPILCEKPAGLSLADAERFAAAERASKAFVLVGHQHLFAEGYEALRGMGVPVCATAHSLGPVARDYPAKWDYGPHAVSMLLGLGLPIDSSLAIWHAGVQQERSCWVRAYHGDGLTVAYDAYASQAEPPLTRQVRAFARAVRNGGTDDYRFGARWAVDVARVLEAAEKSNR